MARTIMIPVVLFLMATLGGTLGRAQTASSLKVDGPPAFNLENVSLAKVMGNGNTVGIIKVDFAVETRVVTVPVTKTRTETRTRIEERTDGRKVEVSYTEEIPYTESVEQVKEVAVPRVVREDLPVNRIAVTTTSGDVVAKPTWIKRLAAPTHVFVVHDQEKWREDKLERLSPYYAAVVRPDTLVLRVFISLSHHVTKQRIRVKIHLGFPVPADSIFTPFISRT
ncbi:hypothetical protein [Rhodopirellula sallentina]|uniref:hypothetical protein n=1 Tax=Rhodopirellula sallentina TaxID=1263869 RepID=UPI0011819B0F|nr:hypothetical protein [Rhodopirellula sallentina]